MGSSPLRGRPSWRGMCSKQSDNVRSAAEADVAHLSISGLKLGLTVRKTLKNYRPMAFTAVPDLDAWRLLRISIFSGVINEYRHAS